MCETINLFLCVQFFSNQNKQGVWYHLSYILSLVWVTLYSSDGYSCMTLKLVIWLAERRRVTVSADLKVKVREMVCKFLAVWVRCWGPMSNERMVLIRVLWMWLMVLGPFFFFLSALTLSTDRSFAPYVATKKNCGLLMRPQFFFEHMDL